MKVKWVSTFSNHRALMSIQLRSSPSQDIVHLQGLIQQQRQESLRLLLSEKQAFGLSSRSIKPFGREQE